jgi:hypothetical protein
MNAGMIIEDPLHCRGGKKRTFRVLKGADDLRVTHLCFNALKEIDEQITSSFDLAPPLPPVLPVGLLVPISLSFR